MADWKSQLANLRDDGVEVAIVRSTQNNLRHTLTSAKSYVRTKEPELLYEGQPLAPAVKQWLPKVRGYLRREHDYAALIVGCQRKNIDPQGSGFIDDDRVKLFENDPSVHRIHKTVPSGVGVLFQARWMSPGRMLPLLNDARAKGVLVVPTLKPSEIRQLITLGRMTESELLDKLQPRLPTSVEAALHLASPETRAASKAMIDGAVRKYVQSEPVAEPLPLDVATSPTSTDTQTPKGGLTQFILDHPPLPGEGVSAHARRLFAMPHGLPSSFRSFENTVSVLRQKEKKRLAQGSPAPGPLSPPPPPPPPNIEDDEDDEDTPPAPPPVNSNPPLVEMSGSGGLSKTMSAISALSDTLSEIELHAGRMSNHGKVLAEHGAMLAEQIGLAKFAIESLRDDLKTGVQTDIEQRMRAALAHVMGGLA